LIVSEKNGGFAAGCNLGITAAQANHSEYILLLNPDTRARDDFIAPMLDILDKNPEIGVAGPTILDDDGSDNIQFAGGKITWWKGGPSHILEDSPLSETWLQTDFVTGCAMLLRTQAIEEAGLMDERYFLYFEDADYVEKLKHSGWKTAFIPSASVLHKLSSTTGFQSENYVYYFARNRLWFLRRWAPSVAYWIYLLIHCFVKIPGAIVVFGAIRSQWNLTRTFFKGTYDGLFSSAPEEHGKPL
jgi:GT2 family glycosyltransferase